MKTDTKFFFLAFLLVIFDQISKFFLPNGSFSSKFIVSFCNKNIAWSIPVAPGFFYLFFPIIFFVMIYFFIRNKFNKLALTFILSGAISNIIDRFWQGCVIDFIDLKIWPVFNFADIYITIGIIILFAIKILNSKH